MYRVRSDVSGSHQEEVKKPEEQASVVTQTAEFPESASTTVDSPRQVEVNVCKDDHQEKIAKFGGGIHKVVMNWHENSSADLEEKLRGDPAYSASTSMPNADRLTRTSDPGAACRRAESHSQSRVHAATQS